VLLELDVAVVALDELLLVNVNYAGEFNVSLDSAYDNFMGRFSVPLARFSPTRRIASGQRVSTSGRNGPLTSELVRRGASPAAADPSPPFVAALHRRLPGVEVKESPAESPFLGPTSRSTRRSRSSS